MFDVELRASVYDSNGSLAKRLKRNVRIPCAPFPGMTLVLWGRSSEEKFVQISNTGLQSGSIIIFWREVFNRFTIAFNHRQGTDFSKSVKDEIDNLISADFEVCPTDDKTPFWTLP